MVSNDCIDCDELPSEARAVRDLYTTKEYFRQQYFSVCEELESLKKELKQLRKREVTP